MSDTKTPDPREIAIRARMAAGLSRGQAEQCQAAQEAHDKALAEAAQPKKPKAAKA